MFWLETKFWPEIVSTLFIVSVLLASTGAVLGIFSLQDGSNEFEPTRKEIVDQKIQSENKHGGEEVQTLGLATEIRNDQAPDEIEISRATPEAEEIDCLALNIYFESRGDNYAGRLGVADVTLNRVRHNYYPNTICEVVKQTVYSKWWKERGREVPARNMCQFSWYCDGLEDIPEDEKAWEDASRIAKNILTNDVGRGITEGSTHYHSTSVDPDWTNDRGMQYIGQIGNHIFYRWH